MSQPRARAFPQSLQAQILFVALLVVAPFGANASLEIGQQPPNALLTIDQNRTTVIDRIMANWGDPFVASVTTIDRSQLRQILEGMRADHLLAASLAGSLDGLRKVVEGAVSAQRGVVAKGGVGTTALGDTGGDVVYTPVTPCRLVETRGTFPAVYQGDGSGSHAPFPFASNEVRTYSLNGGNGVCISQLPAGLGASAVQLQVFAMPISPAASGDVELLPQGSPFGSTATVVYLGSLPFVSTSATVRVNVSNNQIAVQVRGGGANLAMDVVGYFAAPTPTGLECVSVAGPWSPIAATSDTFVPLPSCATGFGRVGSACQGAAGVPSGYLLETSTTGCMFRNLSSASAYFALATSICCRVPGR